MRAVPPRKPPLPAACSTTVSSPAVLGHGGLPRLAATRLLNPCCWRPVNLLLAAPPPPPSPYAAWWCPRSSAAVERSLWLGSYLLGSGLRTASWRAIHAPHR